MPGFEYTAATGMLYEGMTQDALTCIKAIRDRHNGAKRNPFSEPECGHHYARSMASWSAIIALSDFQYSGVDKSLHITNRPGTYFWSNGYAWGTIKVAGNDVTINVMHGSLSLKTIQVGDKKAVKKSIDLSEGGSQTLNTL